MAAHSESSRAESSRDGERFRDIVGNLPAALYATDAEGWITYFNPAAADLWGRSPVIGEDMWCGSWRLYWPDGTPLPHDECPMAVAIKTGKPVRGAEAVCERPDGSRFTFTPFPTPMFDEAGKLTGAVNLLIELPTPSETAAPPAPPVARIAPPDVAIASLFDQTARLVHRDDGASPMQWAIMRYLSRSLRPREEAQVAAYLAEPLSGIAYDLSLLVRHGFVSRAPGAPGESDRLSLTDQGKQALQFDPLKRLEQAIAQLGSRKLAFAAGLEIVADQLARGEGPAK